MYMQHFFYRLT